MSFSFEFNNDSPVHELASAVEPIIWLKKVVFRTTDKNWLQRLGGASLYIEIISDTQARYGRHVSFLMPGAEYLRTPELELNQYIKPSTISAPAQNLGGNNFTITFMLENLTFKEGESLIVEGMHRQHIFNRVNDWLQRVKNIYNVIDGWVEQDNLYQSRKGAKVLMYEPMMEDYDIPQQKIDTLDIFKEGRLLATFKPKGLWVIGINGLIDVISMKGNFVLGDTAEAFQHPQWRIYSQRNSGKGKDFTNEEFLKLL
jgi:hypothetical protein